jgi:hypothetical protein
MTAQRHQLGIGAGFFKGRMPSDAKPTLVAFFDKQVYSTTRPNLQRLAAVSIPPAAGKIATFSKLIQTHDWS